MSFVHEFKFISNGIEYKASIEDENDENMFKEVINRCKTKIFSNVKINITEYKTYRKEDGSD